MKLTQNEIFYINELAKISGVTAKDCIIHKDKISFLVNEEKLGKAIGRKGCNIKELNKKIKKRIELYSYSNNLKEFFEKNLDLKVLEIKNNDSIVEVKAENTKNISYNKRKLQELKMFLKRMNNIKEIKIRK